MKEEAIVLHLLTQVYVKETSHARNVWQGLQCISAVDFSPPDWELDQLC